MSTNNNYAVLEVWHETRTPQGYRLDVTVVAKTYHKPKWRSPSPSYSDSELYASEGETGCGIEPGGDLILLPLSILLSTHIKPCKRCYP